MHARLQAPEIFSASADGKVLRWQLDADENCDIYECVVSGKQRDMVKAG